MTDLGGITEPRTTYISRTQAPQNTGVVSGGGTYVLRVPLPTDGKLKQVRAFGGSASGTMKIRRFVRTPGTVAGSWDFNKIGDDYSVTLTAGVLNTIDVSTPFTANAGEFIALVPASNTVRMTTTTEDSQGYFWNGGDVSSFTLAAGNTGADARWEVSLAFETLAIKQEVLDQADFPRSTGFEEIARSYNILGSPRVQVGFQHADDQDPQAGFIRVYCGEANLPTANGGLPAGSTFFDFTTYQYGGAWKGNGVHGDTVEFQLGSDTEPNRAPELSVRHKNAGATRTGIGSRIQTRDSTDTVGFWLSFQNDSDPHIALDDVTASILGPDTPATLGIYHPKEYGAIVHKIGGNEILRVLATGLRANLPTYADNASAITGGLVPDDFYATDTGELRIVVAPV